MMRASPHLPASIRGRLLPGGRSTVLIGVLGVAILCSSRASLAQSLFSAARFQYSTGYQPETVCLGDLNGDGHLDAITPERYAGLLHVYYGRGDGALYEVSSLPATQPNVIALADYNVDGYLDIAYASNNGHLILLAGDGAGGFTQVLDQLVDTLPYAIAAGDLNLDGRPDLAIGQSEVITVVLFYPGFHTSTNTYFGGGDDAVIGELTGDGLPDIAMGVGQAVLLYPNIGFNRFSGPITYYVLNRAYGIDIGDLTGDGIPDIATSGWYENSVSVLPGDGHGGFGPRQDHEVGYSSAGIQVRDVNHDGRADLIVALGDFYDYSCDCDPWSRVATLLQQPDGTLAPPLTAVTGSAPRDVALGDLDEDGHLDAVTADYYGATVSVLHGNGDGSFGFPPALATDGVPGGLAAGDVTDDGITDLVVANTDENSVSVFPGYPNGTFDAAQATPCGTGPTCVCLADFDRDGHLDAASANQDGTCSVLFGTETGFGPSLTVPAGSSPSLVVAADFTGDGLPDLAFGGIAGVTLVWAAAGRSFTTGPKLPTSAGVTGLVAGDVTADGLMDIVVTASWDSLAYVYHNEGGGAFTLTDRPHVGDRPLAAALADVNHDGAVDILTTRWAVYPEPSRGRVSVLLGQAGGGFGARREFEVDDQPLGLATLDANQDGILDVVTANHAANSATVLLGDGAGAFVREGNYGTGYGPSACATIDLHQDGVPDIAVLDREGNTVSLLASRLAPLPDSVGGTHAPPARGASFLRVGPNPARSRVQLHLRRERWPEPASVSIYDIRGRRVRAMAVNDIQGESQVNWDVCDTAGRRVPSGLYRVEFRDGTARITRAVLVLD